MKVDPKHLVTLLVSLLLLASPSLAKCGSGCLRCDLNGDCLYCDLSQYYFLNSFNNCVQNELKNCLKTTPNGICLLCDVNFYLDTVKNECIQMPMANRINRCLYYSDLFNCSQCEEFFYVKNNVCVEVQKNILNCIKYKSDDQTICLICKEGWIASHDGASCKEVVPIDNCASYTTQSCLFCREGSLTNESAYLNTLNKLNNENGITNFIEYSVKLKQKIWDPINFHQCEILLVSNCLRGHNVFECEECQPGYFLGSDKQCFENPNEAVDYCIKYLAQDFCIECAQGYYPSKNNLCSPIPKIENCEVYSQVSPKCSICKSAFFLNGDKCDKRKISLHIDLCIERSLVADNCASCQKGFVPTNDGLKCLVIIPSCQEYAQMDETFSTAICYKCEEGFYLDSENNQCVFPSVRDHGCKIFQRAFFKCDVCEDGYYLDSQFNCLKHNLDLISLACSQASTNQENACTTCSDGFSLFTTETTCQLITSPISFCEVYKTQEDCLTCEQGYYPPECLAIPSNENCLERDYLDTTCKVCAKGYYLDSNGDCQIPEDSVKVGCDTVEISSLDVFTCQACSSGFYFKKFEQTFICDSSVNTITNCIRYKENALINGGFECLRCQDGYVLDQDTQTCKSTCPVERPLLIKQVIDSNDQVEKINICTTQDALTGCRVAAIPNFDQEGDYNLGCAQCELNNFPYIDFTTDVMNLKSYYGFNFEGLITDIDVSAVRRLNFVKCANLTDLNSANLTTNATPSTGCQLYAKHNGKYVCISCSHGFTGVVKKFEVVADDFVWGIKSCEAITDCVTEVTSYEGIGWELGASALTFSINNFLTCAVCSGSKIPFVHLNLANPSKLSHYKIEDDLPSSGTDEVGKTVECRDPGVALDFGRTDPITFISDCGVGVWLVSEDRTVTANPYYCITCKPGFSATFSTDAGLEWSITACTAIDNCDNLKGGEWFSSCSKCGSGNNWTYFKEANKGYINYALCTSNSSGDPNCQIVDSGNSCLICKEGAFLNEDGSCENYYATDCDKAYEYKWLGNNTPSDPDYSPAPEKFPMMYEALGKGCTACSNSKNALYQENALYACTFSEYISADSFPSVTVFILNCMNYSYNISDGRHTCSGCKSEFRLIENGSKCISKSIEVGCLIYANDETGCNQCEENYTTFNSKCFLNNIPNCTEYTVESNRLTCLNCSDTYYITEGKCVGGEVNNCKEYYTTGDPFACKTCEDKYGLFYTSENKAICLGFDNDSQRTYCNKWNTLSNGEKFYCSECQFGYTLVENRNLSEFSNNLCIGPVKILNCLKYDIKSEPKNSSFLCVECVDGYYANKGACAKRTTITNCSTFVVDEDLCSGCLEGSYLSSSKTECVPFPQGIQGCELYLSESQCQICKSGYYLQHERCVLVEDEKSIPFCSRYSPDQICLGCLPGFFLKQEKCEKASVANCEVYQDKENCKICNVPFGLALIDGKAQCVNKDIPYCNHSTDFFPFKCISCQNRYYSDNGVCRLISKTIDYCVEYETEDTCRFCDQTSTLSKNSKECVKDENLIKSVDSGCQYNSIVAPICNTCNIGYYLYENICQPCQGGASIENGCAYCDPQNPSNCWLCQSGYFFIGSTGLCEKETDLNGDSDDSLWIIMPKFISVLLAACLFLGK